eukprot:m.107171 g.107171  ORF g.107171 m.107171 type:complete len:81 (-) comp13916_c1_seq3:2036-2278(-)
MGTKETLFQEELRKTKEGILSLKATAYRNKCKKAKATPEKIRGEISFVFFFSITGNIQYVLKLHFILMVYTQDMGPLCGF